MPLTGSATVLQDSLRAALLSANCGAVDGAALTAMCNAIATTVVSHITANAVVTPTALLAPPGTAGGPVTGTGTIT